MTKSRAKRVFHQRAVRAGLERPGREFFHQPAVVRVPRFLVKAGTACSVLNVLTNRWAAHVTRKDLGFECFERYDREEKKYEFRERVWVVRVHRSKVIHREDVVPECRNLR